MPHGRASKSVTMSRGRLEGRLEAIPEEKTPAEIAEIDKKKAERKAERKREKALKDAEWMNEQMERQRKYVEELKKKAEENLSFSRNKTLDELNAAINKNKGLGGGKRTRRRRSRHRQNKSKQRRKTYRKRM